MTETSFKITTTCAELPTLNLIRACQAKLKLIQSKRERRRENIIEAQRQKKPMFGPAYEITREQAIQELDQSRDWHWHMVGILYDEDEDVVRGLLALTQYTTSEYVLVSREDFDKIMDVYDPSELGAFTHESAMT